MMDPLAQLLNWVEANESLVRWMFLASGVVFFGTLLAIPVMVARMPADYFVRPQRSPVHDLHWAMRMLFHVAKNALGALFILMGIVMLVTPGQGILTTLVGVGLLDFPGKRALERRIACAPAVRRSIEWIRRRADAPPLELPCDELRGGAQR